jgi:hypothetical protein
MRYRCFLVLSALLIGIVGAPAVQAQQQSPEIQKSIAQRAEQQRRALCESEAAKQKLSGLARDNFLADCQQGQVVQAPEKKAPAPASR